MVIHCEETCATFPSITIHDWYYVLDGLFPNIQSLAFNASSEFVAGSAVG
jgi:hypothetical protein